VPLHLELDNRTHMQLHGEDQDLHGGRMGAGVAHHGRGAHIMQKDK
jgi:hypothetical protein